MFREPPEDTYKAVPMHLSSPGGRRINLPLSDQLLAGASSMRTRSGSLDRLDLSGARRVVTVAGIECPIFVRLAERSRRLGW